MATKAGTKKLRERGNIRRMRDRYQVRISAGDDPSTGERIILVKSVMIEKPGSERSERAALKEAEKARTELLADADALGCLGRRSCSRARSVGLSRARFGSWRAGGRVAAAGTAPTRVSVISAVAAMSPTPPSSSRAVVPSRRSGSATSIATDRPPRATTLEALFPRNLSACRPPRWSAVAVLSRDPDLRENWDGRVESSYLPWLIMGYRTGRRRSVVAGIIIVAGLCSLAPSAVAATPDAPAAAVAPAAEAAAPSVQIVSVRWPIASGAEDFHSAFCPEGWTAIAGGVAVSNPRNMHIVDSRKAGDPRAWFASVRSLGPDGNLQTFDTYATCARDMNVQVRQGTYNPASSPGGWSGRVVEAGCSRPNRIVGGGQDIYPYPNRPQQAYVNSSPIVDVGISDDWHVAIRNYGTTVGNVTVYAVCTSTPLPGYQHVGSPLQSSGGGPAVGTAQCPPGLRVLTGGAESTDGPASIANSYPTNNGTAWTATLYDPFTNTPASGRVKAVCAAI